jgi:hypothetical protein
LVAKIAIFKRYLDDNVQTDPQAEKVVRNANVIVVSCQSRPAGAP